MKDSLNGAAKLRFGSDYDRPGDVEACKRKGYEYGFAKTTAKLRFESVCGQSREGRCVSACLEM